MYDLAGGGGQVSGKDNFLSFDRIGHRAVCLPVVDDAVQENGLPLQGRGGASHHRC